MKILNNFATWQVWLWKAIDVYNLGEEWHLVSKVFRITGICAQVIIGFRSFLKKLLFGMFYACFMEVKLDTEEEEEEGQAGGSGLVDMRRMVKISWIEKTNIEVLKEIKQERKLTK